MTIATNNGVPIIQGGKIVTDCSCCGGWSCYKSPNCAPLVTSFLNNTPTLSINITTTGLSYTRSETKRLEPSSFFFLAGCGNIASLAGCGVPIDSAWTYSSSNVSRTVTLNRTATSPVPITTAEWTYSNFPEPSHENVHEQHRLRISCKATSVVADLLSLMTFPGWLDADLSECYGASYLGFGQVQLLSNEVSVILPPFDECGDIPAFSLDGSASSKLSAPCGGQRSDDDGDPTVFRAFNTMYLNQGLYSSLNELGGQFTASVSVP